MLKTSKTLISSGGTIQYWWAFSSCPPASPPSASRSQKKRGHATKIINSASLDTNRLQLCTACHAKRNLYPPSSGSLRSYRKAHTSSHQQTSPADVPPELYWPALPPHIQPTPYDILAQSPNEPYNKRRFAYLVKLYHPDLCPSKPSSTIIQVGSLSMHPSDLPTSIRIQRYHLLIQAHTILSDPTKRAAYDRYGAGWSSIPPLEELRRENSARGWAAARENPRDTPFHCATWEDWEKWWAREAERRKREDAGIFANDFTRSNSNNGSTHDSAEKMAWWVAWVHARRAAQQNFNGWRPGTAYANDPYPPQSVYVSNGFFVLMLASCIVAGALYEFDRAGRTSTSYMKQLEHVNRGNWKDLDRRKGESREFDSQAQRVGKFLKDRSEDKAIALLLAEKDPPPLPQLRSLPALTDGRHSAGQ